MSYLISSFFEQVSLNVDVDMQQLAKGTPGFSGADLQNLVNQVS